MTVAYSRGARIEANYPEQRTAPTFGAFVDALDADRASDPQCAPYVAGPFNGDGRRCEQGALPRRWTAVDLDGIDADALPDVRMYFARFSGCAWPTRRSTPEQPRERVILELSREATRDESIRLGAALTAELAEHFGDAVTVDPCTFRPEQPCFVASHGVRIARFTGDPLDVDALLAAAAPNDPADGSEARQARAAAADDLAHRFRTGERLHDALAAFTMSCARRGLDRALTRAACLGLLELARPVRGARVDELAGDELDRMIRSAHAKIAATPEPLDIFRQLAAPALPADSFPAVLRDFALTTARAAGHDGAAYLTAALCAAAGAIDDGVRLLLDGRTAWFESARLWAVLIGAPGCAKTPAIRAACAPLIAQHRERVAEYVAAQAAQPDDADPLPRPATFVADTTVEKLSEVLADNPRGVLAMFEELDSWLGSHDAYRGGQGSKDRGDWLRLFDGGPHQVDRIKRGSFFVPNWGVSLLSATTPAGLRRHAKALPPDGLIQRLMPILVKPMGAPDEGVLMATVTAARGRYEQRIRELFALAPGTVRMAAEAAELFRARREALRADVLAVEAMSEPFAAHMAKHAGLLGRVALTLHCAEHGLDSHAVYLSGETMAAAMRLLAAEERHALALYVDLLGGGDGALTLARQVARALVADRLLTVTRRDLAHYCRAWRSAPEDERERALRLLVDTAWLDPVSDGRQYAGRPARYTVNEAAADRFAHEGATLRSRRAQVRERMGL